jgi:segregation and condensation protein A
MNNDRPEDGAKHDQSWQADEPAGERGGFGNIVPLDDVLPSERFVVSLDGYEGPLDLLLSLARTQKVDLSKISILRLAEQYLAFIAEARAMRLEVAADYLVTAAWLAYLKSKLLLPPEQKDEDGLSGEEMALHLAFRLKRLEAMREAVARLFGRQRLGIDFFNRGMPEGVRTIRKSEYWASVYDLLKAYSEQRSKGAIMPVQMGGREVWSVHEARELLERLFGQTVNWSILESYIEDYLRDAETSKTVLASTFGATLEMSREGFIEMRQAQPFAPIYVRRIKRAGLSG